jgi:cytochrome c553
MPTHIVRLLGVMAAFLAVAYGAKQLFTADSFYRYGHYRADSVLEVMAKEPVFQTPGYCRDCHAERHSQWSAGNHKTVSCETCHGAAQGHPEKGKLPIPSNTVQLCTLCHERMPGRPATQPQIDAKQHAGSEQCATCHNPHAPKLAGTAAQVAGDAAAGKTAAAACTNCHGVEGVSPNDTWPNLAGQHPAYLARILAAYKSGDQKDVAMTPFAQALSDADIQNLAAYYGGLACASTTGAPRGDPALGKALANNCSACHGETGIAANPAWPSIAGQRPGYLVNVLKAFRAGLRKDPMMAGVTRALSDADIENLAAYYARQSCRPPAAEKGKS